MTKMLTSHNPPPPPPARGKAAPCSSHLVVERVRLDLHATLGLERALRGHPVLCRAAVPHDATALRPVERLLGDVVARALGRLRNVPPLGPQQVLAARLADVALAFRGTLVGARARGFEPAAQRAKHLLLAVRRLRTCASGPDRSPREAPRPRCCGRAWSRKRALCVSVSRLRTPCQRRGTRSRRRRRKPNTCSRARAGASARLLSLRAPQLKCAIWHSARTRFRAGGCVREKGRLARAGLPRARRGPSVEISQRPRAVRAAQTKSRLRAPLGRVRTTARAAQQHERERLAREGGGGMAREPGASRGE